MAAPCHTPARGLVAGGAGAPTLWASVLGRAAGIRAA